MQAAGKGPHAAAAAQALQAAARKPPARVLFKPAARVAAPERPADAMGAAALATRLPGKQGHPAADELSAEVRGSTCRQCDVWNSRFSVHACMHACWVSRVMYP
jgi:hypothetical protein